MAEETFQFKSSETVGDQNPVLSFDSTLFFLLKSSPSDKPINDFDQLKTLPGGFDCAKISYFIARLEDIRHKT